MERLSFLIDAGGPVIALLILMSVASLAIFLLKLWQISRDKVLARGFVEPAIRHWQSGRKGEALATVSSADAPVGRVMEAAMDLEERGPEIARAEASRVAASELASLRTLLRPLEVIAYLSPLLGLLGTVIGMIRAFRALEQAGSRIDPALLSGGIWEALLTTAAGLIVAIPAVLMVQWLERVAERTEHEMRDAVARLSISSAAVG